MKRKQQLPIRPVLFALSGAVLGLAVYAAAGVSAVSCPVTTLALMGWLLSCAV